MHGGLQQLKTPAYFRAVNKIPGLKMVDDIKELLDETRDSIGFDFVWEVLVCWMEIFQPREPFISFDVDEYIFSISKFTQVLNSNIEMYVEKYGSRDNKRLLANFKENCQHYHFHGLLNTDECNLDVEHGNVFSFSSIPGSSRYQISIFYDDGWIIFAYNELEL